VPSADTIYLFAIACFGLVALPGPAVLYIVTRGIVHGRRGGLMSMFGVEVGDFVQVLAATAGLAAIVASSATAFTAVKYAGAAYLIYLGVRALRERDTADGEAPPTVSDRHLFWNGFLVGALNPKLTLFLLAFLPQFIDPGAGPVWLQTLVLGSIFSVTAAIGDTAFALAAGTAGHRLRRFVRGRGLARASGFVYIGMGIGAALGNSRARS
jgi:threonine/homoserine/homoserine lactone efflux protein